MLVVLVTASLTVNIYVTHLLLPTITYSCDPVNTIAQWGSSDEDPQAQERAQEAEDRAKEAEEDKEKADWEAQQADKRAQEAQDRAHEAEDQAKQDSGW